MSRSLHSSSEYLGSSKRWSRNESDIVPWKSSIGEISSKISSKPDLDGSSPRFVFVDCARRERHKSLPNNQSTLSTCSANRFGTSRGSRILANEIRRGATEFFFAAKRCPSRQRWGRRTSRSQPLYALTMEVFCERVGYRPTPRPVQPAAYTPKTKVCLAPCGEFLSTNKKTPAWPKPDGGFLINGFIT